MPETVAAPNAGTGTRRPSLSITFDNLGEAAEIEMGWWGDRQVGSHKTASFVPKLIEALGDVRATYFVEGSNAEVYPEVIKAWANAGHEVGLHAWRHESWGRCPADRRRELLDRSMDAMKAIGIEPIGFRPPGGAVPDDAWTQFADVGLRYCSGLGEQGVFQAGDLLSIPFTWRSVDAYLLEDVMREVRLGFGDSDGPPGLAEWRTALVSMLNEAVACSGHCTVIFHPEFLVDSDEKLAIVGELIGWARERNMWIAPLREIAHHEQAKAKVIA